MKNTLCSWLNILIGCIIVAAGFVFFINPYNIVPGGAYGASIVLHNLFHPYRSELSDTCSIFRYLFCRSSCWEQNSEREPLLRLLRLPS